MSGAVNVVVVGVGYLGRIHAKIYQDLPQADLVAVVDTDSHVGGEIGRFSAVHVHAVTDAEWKTKLVAASGSLANLLIAATVFPVLRRITQYDHRLVFFVWLFFSMNLMLGTGYWFASGITNTGDWAIVIRYWEPHWLYQICLIVLGIASLMAAVAWSLIEFGRIVDAEGAKPVWRAQYMAMVCYATAFAVMLVVGTAQPGGPFAFPGVAGLIAVLGGLSPLLWMMQWFSAHMFKRHGTKPLQIERSNWSIALAVGAVLFATVMTAIGQR